MSKYGTGIGQRHNPLGVDRIEVKSLSGGSPFANAKTVDRNGLKASLTIPQDLSNRIYQLSKDSGASAELIIRKAIESHLESGE